MTGFDGHLGLDGLQILSRIRIVLVCCVVLVLSFAYATLTALPNNTIMKKEMLKKGCLIIIKFFYKIKSIICVILSFYSILFSLFNLILDTVSLSVSDAGH